MGLTKGNELTLRDLHEKYSSLNDAAQAYFDGRMLDNSEREVVEQLFGSSTLIRASHNILAAKIEQLAKKIEDGKYSFPCPNPLCPNPLVINPLMKM